MISCTRWLMLVGLLILGCMPAGAASVSEQAVRTRELAEASLAEARARIAEERAEAMRRLQAAHAQAARARERLDTVRRSHQDLQATLERREREEERAIATLRSLVDRAVIGARLDDAAQARIARAEPRERAQAAIDAALARLEALPGRLTRSWKPEGIIARDGQLAETPVLRLGEARALAVGDQPATRGLLVRTDDGSAWRVSGPALPDEVRGPGVPPVIVLDPDGTVAGMPPLQSWTLTGWLTAGRFFIWPIIAVMVIGILVSLERLVAFARLRVDPRRLLHLAAMLRHGDGQQAETAVAHGSTPLDRVIAIGLNHRIRSREAREAAVDQALLMEAPRFQRGLGTILVMAGIAPLLGLLGTVTGMIDMFAVIAQQGSGSAKSLSGAISEALVCTQAGMIAAIPLLLLHAALNRIADRRLMLLEEAACAVLGLETTVDEVPPVTAGATA